MALPDGTIERRPGRLPRGKFFIRGHDIWSPLSPRAMASYDLTPDEVDDIFAHLNAGDEVTIDAEYRPARRHGPDPVRRRYEQRAVLVEGHAGGVGEWLLDAGACWQSGLFRDGFPSAKDPHTDWVASAETVVDCECDCDCDWYGPFGEVDPDQGVMRCPACVAAGHPPGLRSPVHYRH